MAPTPGPVSAVSTLVLALAGGWGFGGFFSSAPDASNSELPPVSQSALPVHSNDILDEEGWSAQVGLTALHQRGFFALALCANVLLALTTAACMWRVRRRCTRPRAQKQQSEPASSSSAEMAAKPCPQEIPSPAEPPPAKIQRELPVNGSATSKISFSKIGQPQDLQPPPDFAYGETTITGIDSASVDSAPMLREEDQEHSQPLREDVKEEDDVSAPAVCDSSPALSFDAIDAPAEMEWKCRSCGNTGTAFTGETCVCKYGQKLLDYVNVCNLAAQEEEESGPSKLAEVHEPLAEVHEPLAEVHEPLAEVHEPLAIDPELIDDEFEAPAGVKANFSPSGMPTWSQPVYTLEQQERLGVDEEGKVLPTPDEQEGESEHEWDHEQQHEQHCHVAAVPEEPMPVSLRQQNDLAWTRGEIEEPAGKKDIGLWTVRVYTAEQQARLRVDENGNALAAPQEYEEHTSEDEPEAHGCSAIGPAWTRGEIEAPAGVQDMGTWSAGVYTEEQQERLCVDEYGRAVAEPEAHACSAIGPAWTRGEIEAPAGVQDMGTWSAGVYTEEQQDRLSVDEDGSPVAAPKDHLLSALGPAWTRGEIEAPAGLKDMGTWTARVYTEEQQEEFAVDEYGQPLPESLELDAEPGLEEIEPPAGVKDMGGRSALVYTADQQRRLGIDEWGVFLEVPKSESIEIVPGMAELTPEVDDFRPTDSFDENDIPEMSIDAKNAAPLDEIAKQGPSSPMPQVTKQARNSLSALAPAPNVPLQRRRASY